MKVSNPLVLATLLAGLPLAANAQSICFTVAGEKASVHNAFKDGKPQVVELDMPSISTMASRGPESRNMIFTRIKRDDKKNLTAFSAKIDGKDYEFPKDACKGK
jgi:electron transfer flavoprotein alpha/beta subunit